MAKENMYKLLQSALNEKDVENIYRSSFEKHPEIFPFTITSPHGTDGVLSWYNEGAKKQSLIILEFKYNKDFTKRTEVIRVIIQILYYLKIFERYGDDLPTVCLIGDTDECFCFHTNDIIDYLSEDADWSVAPSEAPTKVTQIFKKMYGDDKISPYVFGIDERFDFRSVIKKAIELDNEIVNFVRITEQNINRVFNDFTDNVLYSVKVTKQNANELVNVFITTVLNEGDNYLHPKKPQTLVTEDFGNIRIHRNKFLAFFRHFQRDYSPREKDRLAAICDRLIEDTARRFQGEFFTPTEWVIEAHKMIEAEFGDDWKEKYVVWDPAWGIGNLTRDYKFRELYASTLNESDLGIAKQMGYNPEATRFQYDFLNDPYNKLPMRLRKAIESGGDMIVLMNPPYAKSAGHLKIGGGAKKGLARTKVNVKMLADKMGKACGQLYAQFIYKINEFGKKYKCKISVATFTPPLFITGSSYEKFRHLIINNFEYRSGALFNAGHFSNVKANWGVLFSLWTNDKCVNKEFPVEIKGLDKEGRVTILGSKNLYNTEGLLAGNVWAKESIKSKDKFDCPQLSNPINVAKDGAGRYCDNFLGYMNNNGNSTYHNGTLVGLYSSGFSGGSKGKGNSPGFPFTEKNIYNVIALFTARKTITSNWVNQKDEYLAPNTEHPDYAQWNRDCLVYSLFNNSSNQSSLRRIDYKGEKWDIENQWFWLSNKEMLELADKEHNHDLYRDCKNFDGDRFVYKRLQEIELSDHARGVLDHATELLKGSFEYRNMLANEHPEYHLSAWDAGWYQIKLILKEYSPDWLKEFSSHYRAFENDMRKGVYKFGFLK